MNIEELLSNLSINHLSYSAVRCFIEDPRNFKKRYIDYIYDDKTPVPMAIGSAYHAGLETFWTNVQNGKDTDINEMIEQAKNSLLTNDVDYGKKRIAKKDTENYEAMGCEVITDNSSGKNIVYAMINDEVILTEVARYFEHYLENTPLYNPLHVEAGITDETIDFETSDKHLIPLKGFMDLLARDKDGKLICVDHKLMGGKPKTDEDGKYIIDPAMKLQACAYETLIPSIMDGEKPAYFVFDVMVKNNSPELHSVKIELTDADRLAWSRLFKGTIYKILVSAMFDDPDIAFTPNPRHMYNKDGWNEYMIDIDYRLKGINRPIDKGAEKEKYEALDL